MVVAITCYSKLQVEVESSPSGFKFVELTRVLRLKRGTGFTGVRGSYFHTTCVRVITVSDGAPDPLAVIFLQRLRRFNNTNATMAKMPHCAADCNLYSEC
jgi:hypothetical protein